MTTTNNETLTDQLAWNVLNASCPTRLVLNRIADKWTVLTVVALTQGTKRFSQLQREVGGISQKMLTQTLRGLERDGLVERTVYATVPPKVEYTLTPLGNTLVKLVGQIRNWSENHIQQVLNAQINYDKTLAELTQQPGVYRHKL